MVRVTDLLIHAGHIFTAADRDPLLHDGWVRVEDDRIVDVSSSEPAGPSGALRLVPRGDDRYVAPGQIGPPDSAPGVARQR